MRLSAVKKLVNTNLIYTAQPASLAKWRKQQLKNPNRKIDIGRKIAMPHLFGAALYVFLFVGMGALNPYEKSPGLFSNMILFFALFGLSQGFLSFYNVFYESKDLESYMPLAFTEGEVLLGKSVSVLLTMIIALFPIIGLFVLLQVKLGNNILLAIPEVLISIFLLITVTLGGTVVLVHSFTKTSLFRQHKKFWTNVLVGLSTLMMIGAIFYVNFSNNAHLATDDITTVGVTFPPARIFYDIAANPFAASTLLNLLGWLLVSAAIAFLLKYKVAKEFYQAAAETSNIVSVKKRVGKAKTRRHDGSKSFANFVWSYQWGLVSEGSILAQTVLMAALLPFIFASGFLIPLLQKGDRVQMILHSHPTMILPFFVAGLAFGAMNSSQSLMAVGISLERENFDYLKVLPFDMRYFLTLKFWILFAIQATLPILLFIAMGIWMGAPWYQTLFINVGWFISAYITSVHLYKRDHKLFVSNWSNVTELFTRETSTMRTLQMIVVLILGIALIVGSGALALLAPTALSYAVFILLLLVTIGLSLFVHIYKFKPFVASIQE
ncbi:hypothetical protein [Streptococcus massiliensis]|uniref:ABC transporter membrane protein n=1 Tax=Streptococcus massiliensis TaxID=313439 RepID=A0A380KVJ3_9STRE|nr:hypothetical protein [Streptococcus massiliensis]SUN75942.1 ABC transporter membrane protein [Streptococcus massiliensis]